jgi:hypothetical protein
MPGVEYEFAELLADVIDPNAMTVTLKAQPNSGLLGKGRYLFSNVFDELDRPGEYYIDKSTGLLYLYPTKNMASATVKISRLEEPYMFSLSGASYITFSGLTAELTKGSVMSIIGGSNCSVEDNTFKNFGLNGVRVGDGALSTYDFLRSYGNADYEANLDIITAAENGFDHSIRGCTFLNTGYTAATIASGNVAYRESGGMVFEGNVVMHSGLIGSCYFSGLTVNGCGITIKNNAFFYCRGQAVSGWVVDTEVLYNEFCDSPCEMAEDTGTLYFNYMSLNDGVKVRYNYFHDVSVIQSSGYGYPLRGAGAYYDNHLAFKDFSYNVVYNAPYSSMFIEHYLPATSVGNIIIDVVNSADSIPVEWMRDDYNGETGKDFLEANEYSLGLYFKSGLYKNDLWRKNYPEFYKHIEYLLTKQDLYPLMSDIRDNIVVYLGQAMNGRSGILPASMPVDPKYGKYGNNRFFTSDPGFVDFERYDFQLTKEAAKKYGVEWIDMSKIGVPGLEKPVRVSDSYNDPWRWVLPDKYPMIQFMFGNTQYNEPWKMVSFWRLVEPGVWVWECDDKMVGDGYVGYQLKAGTTYTVYYPGGEDFPPQFLGGLDGEYPPDGVLTFTVDFNRDRWNVYVFELVP